MRSAFPASAEFVRTAGTPETLTGTAGVRMQQTADDYCRSLCVNDSACYNACLSGHVGGGIGYCSWLCHNDRTCVDWCKDATFGGPGGGGGGGRLFFPKGSSCVRNDPDIDGIVCRSGWTRYFCNTAGDCHPTGCCQISCGPCTFTPQRGLAQQCCLTPTAGAPPSYCFTRSCAAPFPGRTMIV
jgi:hypothetical protein